MKVKLKTLEQLKRDFESETKWIKSSWSIGSYDIRFNNSDMKWHINRDMVSMFGKHIEVEKARAGMPLIMTKEAFDKKWYTHYGMGYVWHESWFEPEFEDFLSKEDMMI